MLRHHFSELVIMFLLVERYFSETDGSKLVINFCFAMIEFYS
jgi:hypothetical protein